MIHACTHPLHMSGAIHCTNLRIIHERTSASRCTILENVSFLWNSSFTDGRTRRGATEYARTRAMQRFAYQRGERDSCERERTRRCVSSYPRARRCVRHAQCVARTARTYVPREPRFIPLAANRAARLSAVPRARIRGTNRVLTAPRDDLPIRSSYRERKRGTS